MSEYKLTERVSLDASDTGVLVDVSFLLEQKESGDFVATVDVRVDLGGGDERTIADLKTEGIKRAKELIALVVSNK